LSSSAGLFVSDVDVVDVFVDGVVDVSPVDVVGGGGGDSLRARGTPMAHSASERNARDKQREHACTAPRSSTNTYKT